MKCVIRRANTNRDILSLYLDTPPALGDVLMINCEAWLVTKRITSFDETPVTMHVIVSPNPINPPPIDLRPKGEADGIDQ